MLALLTYARWSNNDVYDLRNAEISLYLRGDQLDLKGSSIYFWILGRQRYHFIAHPLNFTEGAWGKKLTFRLINDESLWHRSYFGYPRNSEKETLDYNLKYVESYGFSFVGFPQNVKVTGKLSIDEFRIVPESDLSSNVNR